MLEDEIETHINERTIGIKLQIWRKSQLLFLWWKGPQTQENYDACLASNAESNASQIAKARSKATKGNTDRLRAQVLAARQSECVKKS